MTLKAERRPDQERFGIAITAARLLATGFAGLMLLWIRRAETRRALARLDAERLRDIGIGEEAARRECAKPFWRG